MQVKCSIVGDRGPIPDKTHCDQFICKIMAAVALVWYFSIKLLAHWWKNSLANGITQN
jgi:hypothetical protein